MTPIDAYLLGQAAGENGLANNFNEIKSRENQQMYLDGYINGRCRLNSAIQSLINRGVLKAEWLSEVKQ